MAQKTQEFDWKKFFSDRSQAISSGVLALILIVLAFLALNTISETNKTNNNDKQDSKQEDTMDETSTDQEQNNDKDPQTTPTTINHTVAKGESLWKIAIRYYNDGYRWTQIANENSLTNPDKLEKGQVLKISNVASTTTTTGSSEKQESKITYTVQKGDSLWFISQKFYSGNGYHWVIIRDANMDKVGLLSNGRPRIEPGTVLTIPQLK